MPPSTRSVFRAAEFLKDVCVDLSVVGIDKQLCGGSLKGLCSLWADLNVDFLSYGAMLFVIAQLMFMGEGLRVAGVAKEYIHGWCEVV